MRGCLSTALLIAAAVFSSRATRAETIRVAIDRLVFSPADAQAKVGDTIEWTNGDVVAHTATARGGGFDVTIPAKGSARLTLSQSGDFAYFCRYHPNMTGRLKVEAP